MARDMLCNICGDSLASWRLATDAALSALDARQGLWDGIEAEIVPSLQGAALGAAQRARERYTDQRVAAVPTEAEAERTNSFFVRLIYILSVVVCAAVAFLIYGPRPEALHGQLDVGFLPTVNATLNGAATVLLVVALWFVKRGDIRNHKRAMMTAFGVSAAFLVTYVIYHWFKEGPRPYTGEFRGLYLSVLASHILLAITVLPLSMLALYRGWSMQVAKHKRIVRWAYPIWLYVSVTGVAIYFFLY
jgi:putative membrane protein